MNIHAWDAHCHADILWARDGEFETQYHRLRLGGISWSYAHNISSWRDYPAYWRHLERMCTELAGRGLRFYYLVGIHPRCIPQDLERKRHLPQELGDELADHLQKPLCRGLGELGLETGSEEEKKVFRWQLELAASHISLGPKIGVHTPKKDKEDRTRSILEVLGEYPQLQENILVDHVTARTWSMVWEQDFRLGMTLQPGKCDVLEVHTVLDQEPELQDRLIVNSDGATEMSRPFLQAVQEWPDLDRCVWDKLFRSNAERFWGVQSHKAKSFSGS